MTTRSLAAHATSRDNNFDVLRLTAAFLVLVSHSWALTARSEPSFAGDSLGGLGVTAFFAISGFLVARSWDLDPRAPAFVLKRVLRLWPALIVVVVLAAGLLGPLVTTMPLGDYFSAPTAQYLRNAALDIHYVLPGVFHGNPYPDAVNGSLWTLPVEVKAYAIVLVLGLARLLRRWPVLVVLLALLTWVLTMPAHIRPDLVRQWFEGPLQTRLTIVFVGAALLYSLREHIPVDWRIAALAAVAAGVTANSGLGVRAATWALTVPYLVLYLAYRTPAALRALVKPGDLSYGIYLWAFPVQQTIVQLIGADAEPGWVLALSSVVTYAIAFVSWRVIEAPALRLKRRLPVTGARRPTPAL